MADEGTFERYLRSRLDFQVSDIPGARSLLPAHHRDGNEQPASTGCAHSKPLKLLTDNLAVCWACGQQYEVERF